MRFELIDQVLERSDSHLVGIKNVTLAEEYLADHFPTFPVLPGVMMLETLVQAARLMLEERSAEPLVLGQVRNLRYGNMVRPGQSLKVEVHLRESLDGSFELQGAGLVDGQTAVQGRFSLVPLSAQTFTSPHP